MISRASLLLKWLKMVFIFLLGFGGSFGLRIFFSFSAVAALLEPADVPQPLEG